MVSLYFQNSLLELDTDEVNQFLFSVAKEKTASSTYFKHTVYGLRFFFRLYGLEDRALRLPSLSNDGNLPVVLSCEELRGLFFAPQRLNRRGPPYQRTSANLNFEVR
jgi:integrase/recombinase XerD